MAIPESKVPKGAKKYYLCAHAATGRPCPECRDQPCIYPRCETTPYIANARPVPIGFERQFRKSGNDYFEVKV